MLPFVIDELLKHALAEDIHYLDPAADYLLPPDAESDAYYIAKASGVLCGIDFALRTFTLLDPDVQIEKLFCDGDTVKEGDILARMHGRTASLLKAERTSLNILQHLSGIATATNRCVRLVEGTNASVTDTRKTLPGLRALQKYAVTMGGGRNHRFNLSDAAMLKDNHIDACGSITKALEALRARVGHMVMIEVETRSLEELREALAARADVIMLDNMDCPTMAEAVRITAGRAKLEASGNITEENIRAVAETGVDIISLGALTHSVTAFDISMKMK